MSEVNIQCPLCGKSEWVDIETSSYTACVSNCGMMYSKHASWFRRNVGKYIVLWRNAIDFHGIHPCRIWTHHHTEESLLGDRVYRGDPLPFDITEDMVKFYLVFQ